MKQRIVVGLIGIGLCVVAGCGGSGNSTNTGGGVGGTPTTSASIYTLQSTSFSAAPTAVLQFSSSQSGSVSPTATVNMPSGVFAYGIATDSGGNLYIATNNAARSAPAVLVYTPSTSGGLTLSRTLSGSATKLTYPQSVALDASNQLYVLNGDGSVDIFAAAANGNVAPTRSFTAANGDTDTSIAADSTGNVYLGGFISDNLYVYSSSATGNVMPSRTLTGSATLLGKVFNLAVDSSGELWAGVTGGATAGGSNTGGQILIFAAGANGNVAPVRSLSGTATGFANLNAFAFDSTGRIYEADSATFSNLTGNTINIFSAGASGNVAPTAKITSSAWTTGYEGTSLAAF